MVDSVGTDMADTVTIPAAELAALKARLAELEAERELRERFDELAAQWHLEADVHSMAEKFEVAPYRAIIALGPRVVPLILRELEKAPDHWYVALEELTGARPSPPEHRGVLAAIAEDWVRWGREQGLLR